MTKNGKIALGALLVGLAYAFRPKGQQEQRMIDSPNLPPRQGGRSSANKETVVTPERKEIVFTADDFEI